MAILGLRAIERLAIALMKEHNLIEHGWTFKFCGSKIHAGWCDYAPVKVISLSSPLVTKWDESDVKEIILHEIAHAIAGSENHHNSRWRMIARGIGATGDRCYSAELPRLEAAWKGVCPNDSSHVVSFHRIPIRVNACTDCIRKFNRGRFSPDYIFTWTKYGQTVPMHDKYIAELERINRRYSR